jgi:uncharacterized protein
VSQPIEPISTTERYEVLDVLRGVALLGVLVANLTITASLGLVAEDRASVALAAWDKTTAALISVFVSTKFLSLFGFLFGYGFAVQVERGALRGSDIVGVYRRRLLVLLVIGACHAVFLWWGDILLGYAVGGLFLLAVRERSQKALLRFGLVVTFVGYFVVAVYPYLGTLFFEAHPLAQMAARGEIFRTGSYLDVVRQNVLSLVTIYHSLAMPMNLLTAYGLFFVGYVAGRRHWLTDDDPALKALRRRLLPWALGVGLAGNVFFMSYRNLHVFDATSPWVLLAAPFIAIGLFALATAYALTVVRLHSSSAGPGWLQPIANVGRMALTSYLLQSLAYVVLLYGVGFGLMGRLGTTSSVLLALAIYLVQVGFATLWLRRFRYGPAEWLWRRLTYGRLT